MLERQLQREIDQRREERFLWIFAVVGALDLASFGALGVAAISGIVILEIVFLTAAARWCGVDHVVVLLDRLFHWHLRDKPPND